MRRNWIIDVLADLRSFARDNDLPLLYKQLEEAGLVAEVEIASAMDRTNPHQQADSELPCAKPEVAESPRQS